MWTNAICSVIFLGFSLLLCTTHTKGYIFSGVIRSLFGRRKAPGQDLLFASVVKPASSDSNQKAPLSSAVDLEPNPPLEWADDPENTHQGFKNRAAPNEPQNPDAEEENEAYGEEDEGRDEEGYGYEGGHEGEHGLDDLENEFVQFDTGDEYSPNQPYMEEELGQLEPEDEAAYDFVEEQEGGDPQLQQEETFETDLEHPALEKQPLDGDVNAEL